MPLTVHFLHVSRGDCAIVEFPSGNIGMIDICDIGSLDPQTREELLEQASPVQKLAVEYAQNRLLEAERVAKSLVADTDDPVDYALSMLRGRSLFRLIITHPHMDHVSGLDRLCTRTTPLNFWHAGDDDFDLANSSWDSGPYREADWLRYKALRRSSTAPKALVNRQLDTGDYWTQDGVEILGPDPLVIAAAQKKNDPNILSQVLQITHRGWSFIFGGDADADESWPDIQQTFELAGKNVLKASHHGRRTGYNQAAVKEIAPWLTITSVAERAHDATRLYRQYSQHTVSLRDTGTFSLRVDDAGELHYPSVLSDHWKDQT